MRARKKNKKTVNPFLQSIRSAARSRDGQELEKLFAEFMQKPAEQRKNGAQTLAMLLIVKEGREQFIAHPEWRKSITVSELNDGGALLCLAKSPEGRQLIDEDDLLRNKITPQGFCRLGSGGHSPAYYYLHWMDSPGYLIKHAHLRACLTAETLNVLHGNASAPSIYSLAQSENGIKVLSDPNVIANINAEGLGFIVVGSSRSTLFLLTKSAEGIELLAHERLQALIPTKTLNLVDRISGDSVVKNLTMLEEGLQLIEDNSAFRKKIKSETLNALSANNTSPVFYIAKHDYKGIPLLRRHKSLRNKVTEVGLNAVCNYGKDKGASAVYWLLACHQGRELLRESKRLREMISVRALTSVVASAHEAENSALKYLLAKANKGLVAMLRPELQELVERARCRDKGGQEESNLMVSQVGMFAPDQQKPPAHDKKQAVNKETSCVVC